MQILDEKMKAVMQTKATIVVTTNPGCLLQMALGIEREKMTEQIQSKHLVEVLAEACNIQWRTSLIVIFSEFLQHLYW